MSDVEERLRYELADSSWDVLIPPDPVAWVYRRVARQRVERLAAVAAGVAIVVGIAVAVPQFAAPRASVLQNGVQPTGAPSTPAPHPAQVHYLPAGVALLPPQPDPGGTDVQHTFYGLGSDGGRAIQLIARPGTAVEVYPSDSFTATAVIHHDGVTYYESYPRTGFGTFRLDWTDGNFVYSLMVDRLNLPGGPSGVPFDELKRMAFSAS